MIWTAFYSGNGSNNLSLFPLVCSIIAKKQNIGIGLISSREDRDLLEKEGIVYCDHINANVSGKNGAQTKLKAILKYLPEESALCDMDVIFTKPTEDLDKNLAYALNPEPLLFYKNYAEQSDLAKSCVPLGDFSINAGFLYAPQKLFRKYAEMALELSHKINCIGITYEQMFFVKFCQENNLPLNFIYPEVIHSHKAIEKCYQLTGIRHPFSFKHSLYEVQRFITIGLQYGDASPIINWVNKNMPMHRPMLYSNIFKQFDASA